MGSTAPLIVIQLHYTKGFALGFIGAVAELLGGLLAVETAHAHGVEDTASAVDRLHSNSVATVSLILRKLLCVRSVGKGTDLDRPGDLDHGRFTGQALWKGKSGHLRALAYDGQHLVRPDAITQQHVVAVEVAGGQGALGVRAARKPKYLLKAVCGEETVPFQHGGGQDLFATAPASVRQSDSQRIQLAGKGQGANLVRSRKQRLCGERGAESKRQQKACE